MRVFKKPITNDTVVVCDDLPEAFVRRLYGLDRTTRVSSDADDLKHTNKRRRPRGCSVDAKNRPPAES